jgi:transcription elongation GreA/GreB family factor
MMITKPSIHRACLDLMEAKITALQKALDDLSAGVDSESKSTAGDKHETGRAMVQIEQARLGKQLSELVLQQNALRSINPDLTTDRIVNGSLVRVAQGMFYLSIALGKIEVDGVSVMTLSTASPLGRCWLGAKAGEVRHFNGVAYSILEVS